MYRREEFRCAGRLTNVTDDQRHRGAAVAAALASGVDEETPQEVTPRSIRIAWRHVVGQHHETDLYSESERRPRRPAGAGVSSAAVVTAPELGSKLLPLPESFTSSSQPT